MNFSSESDDVVPSRRTVKGKERARRQNRIESGAGASILLGERDRAE